MKKRPIPPDPMLFKKHVSKQKAITVFDRNGNRVTLHGIIKRRQGQNENLNRSVN